MNDFFKSLFLDSASSRSFLFNMYNKAAKAKIIIITPKTIVIILAQGFNFKGWASILKAGAIEIVPLS